MRSFSITEAATLLLLAYFASKILGVIRQSLFNSLFGVGPAATAYYVAFNIPDTIFNLIAGGALVHALVPVFLAYEKERGRADVWRFVSLVFNILLVALTAIIIVAEIVTPQFVSKLLAPGLTPQEQALTATLTRIMLLQPLILGLGSIATAVLHSKRQFMPSAISIAIYDVGLIGGILFARAVPAVGIYGPTVGLLVSACCQVAVLVPGLMKLGAHYTFNWNLRNPGLRQLLSLLGPNVLTIAVTSAGSIVITSLATYLPDKASIAAIHNASLLFGLPLTLLGLTLANALLPQITIYVTNGRYVRMSWTVWRIVGAATLLSIPAAILLYILGRPAISLLFQHGAFNGHAAALTSTALLGLAIGLPGQTLGLLIVLGFYALKDALTPLLIGILELGIHISLALGMLHLFKGGNLILALPLAGSVSATLAAVALCLILLLRLRAKVSKDRGMQRLMQQRERLQAATGADQSAVGAINRPLQASLGDPTNGKSYGFAVGPDLSWAAPIYRPSTAGDHKATLPVSTSVPTFMVHSSTSIAMPFESPGQNEQRQQTGYQFAHLDFVPGTYNYSRSDDAEEVLSPLGRGVGTRFIASDGVGGQVIDGVGLMALVQQHIARIHNPDTDPVVLLEMLTNICRHLSNDGQELFEQVIHVYRQAAITTRAAPLQFMLGELYFRARSYDKAVDAYMLAMQYSPFEVIARVRAAQCLLSEGLPGVAILQLEQAQQRLHDFTASPLHAHVWQVRPLTEGEIVEEPEVVISQLFVRATESRVRQEQMHSFLRRVNQTPSSYHEVAHVHTQFVTGHQMAFLQEHIQAEPDRAETHDELAETYKIQGILHETIAKLCEQVVIYVRNNQMEQARAAILRISTLYMQLGNTYEADIHMRRAEDLVAMKGYSPASDAMNLVPTPLKDGEQ